MKPSILDLPYRVGEPLGIREGFGALMDLGDGSTLRSREEVSGVGVSAGQWG